jgi:hypothetical protein
MLLMADHDTHTGDLAHAVGAELQAHREHHDWPRPALAACSDGQATVKTLISWEKATRSMALRQLGLAGQIYQIRPSELLLRAERRITWDSGVAVDLDALATSQLEPLRPVVRWARQQRHAGQPPFLRLSPGDIATLAGQCRLSPAHLTILLSTEAPVHR